MIYIHYDFVDGTEISYAEGKERKDNFTTNCLDFFQLDKDVTVMKKDGSVITTEGLLINTGVHTNKQIRKEHNIHKMLVAGAFTWIKPVAPMLLSIPVIPDTPSRNGTVYTKDSFDKVFSKSNGPAPDDIINIAALSNKPKHVATQVRGIINSDENTDKSINIISVDVCEKIGMKITHEPDKILKVIESPNGETITIEAVDCCSIKISDMPRSALLTIPCEKGPEPVTYMTVQEFLDYKPGNHNG